MNALWESFLDGKYRCYVKEEKEKHTMYFEDAYQDFKLVGQIYVNSPSSDVDQSIRDWMVAATRWVDGKSK
jgi:hypothetical protein